MTPLVMPSDSLLALSSSATETVAALALCGCFALWLWAFVDCVKHERSNQTFWLLFILFLGLIGAPLYLLCRVLPRGSSRESIPGNFFCCRCGQPCLDDNHLQINVFGIPKLTCSSCGEDSRFPASKSVKNVCWITLISFPIIGSKASGSIPELFLDFWLFPPILWAIISLNGSFRWAGKVKRAQEFFMYQRPAHRQADPWN